ncbi:MAG: efflux RND transporter periplasmic adaptor subunit, partial [Bacteroidaceae bacterium]|nr:efflux RND transporter periplasmic adaptor subunit [Bacteroidaceae bacterium]
MDIKLKKRPWYFRHKYYIILGAALFVLIVYNIIVMAGPTTVSADAEELKIAVVMNDEFREYVDVEGLVQPIMSIKVNAREGGSVSGILSNEGAMVDVGDTILVIDNPELHRDIDDEGLAWERQRINHQLQQYQMEQKSLSLRQQVLQ